MIEIQGARYPPLRCLLIAGWIRKPERQRDRPSAAAPVSMIGGHCRYADRVQTAAEKDAGPCAANRTRYRANKGRFKSLGSLSLVARLAQVYGRNIPITPYGPLPVLKIDQRSARYPAHGLKIGFLRVRPAV